MTDKPTLTPLERALECARLALDKKALDVKILKIGRLSSIADYLVLASGRSDRQVQAIADSVKKGLKKYGKALDVEGLKEGNWVVIDYGDVLVHVFQEEVRRYYNLDELWSSAPTSEIPDAWLWEGKEGIPT
ncbi:ribosome silencing factor [Geobacter hydrogenophilus]|uniref:Ribosomal silencing factor RsfS n=1 Tax=Geobacter hydrogenophilus TaxID=40983 RepID=A0A9W6LB33_9BACT|nr:ribosome silencing factor [Geobacter hydrogenophilus]MBT0893610.1 ribosome silencing factor [Geobacter hydrogenophilus]GLI37693.1 ribosomal silencing factor RsfS [Geobacter hydrogenophilus]